MHRSLALAIALIAIVACGSPSRQIRSPAPPPPPPTPQTVPTAERAQLEEPPASSSSSPTFTPPTTSFDWSEPPRTIRWEGIELRVHGTPGYNNDLIAHLDYAEGTVAAIEHELVSGLQAVGWTLIHREAGLTGTDREILADPEIDEEVKAVWNVEDKVEITMRRGADELTVWVEPDDQAKYEARLMLLRAVDALRRELEAIQPCLRARLCCRAAADSLGSTCDFSDGKTLVEPTDCERRRAAYAKALEQAGHEVPPVCTAE